MEGNKHFIRTDDQGRIIKGFSDAFEQPQEDDICINEHGGRHFGLFGQINPSLFQEQGIPIYKWDGENVVERTTEEIQADIDALPLAPKSQIELMQEQIDELTLQLGDALLGGDVR